MTEIITNISGIKVQRLHYDHIDRIIELLNKPGLILKEFLHRQHPVTKHNVFFKLICRQIKYRTIND
jgi:hypothetical protein